MISLWDYYVAANEIHRWVQELEDTLGVEVKRSAPVYEALSKVRDVAFDDIDARGVAAEFASITPPQPLDGRPALRCKHLA